jgi:hypothetical protein
MRLLALCCGGDWPTGICGSRARQQRVCARDRPTFGDLAVIGDEKNEIPISIGPGAIVVAAAKLRKCLRHVFIFGFPGSGAIRHLKSGETSMILKQCEHWNALHPSS